MPRRNNFSRKNRRRDFNDLFKRPGVPYVANQIERSTRRTVKRLIHNLDFENIEPLRLRNTPRWILY